METPNSLIRLHHNYVTFDELRPCRPNHHIVSRLLRSWFSSTVTNEEASPGTVLILIDVKDSANLGWNITTVSPIRFLGVLAGDGLPNQESSKYYRVMAHRDRLIRGRRLASSGDDQSLVSFADGNETVRVDALGL